ncbi:hypothetical protein YC2023_082451 [Brassica napus]
MDEFIVNSPSESTTRVLGMSSLANSPSKSTTRLYLGTSLVNLLFFRHEFTLNSPTRVTGRVTASRDEFIVNFPSESTTRVLGMSFPVNSPSKCTTRLGHQIRNLSTSRIAPISVQTTISRKFDKHQQPQLPSFAEQVGTHLDRNKPKQNKSFLLFNICHFFVQGGGNHRSDDMPGAGLVSTNPSDRMIRDASDKTTAEVVEGSKADPPLATGAAVSVGYTTQGSTHGGCA